MDVKITFNDFTVTGANQLNNVTIKLLKGEKGDPGEPTDAQVTSAVNTWLAAHPEATTTVQDGAISYAKLDSNLKATADDVSDLKSSIGYESKVIISAFPNSSGVIEANNSWDCHCFKCAAGSFVNKITLGSVSQQLLYAFYTDEPEIGSVSYNNARIGMGSGIVTASNVKVPNNAPWIAIRVAKSDRPTIAFSSINDINLAPLNRTGNITVNDLNDITQNTIYYVSKNLVSGNFPTGYSVGYVITVIFNTTNKLQVFFAANGSGGVQRACVNGTWSSWEKLGQEAANGALTEALQKAITRISNNGITDADAITDNSFAYLSASIVSNLPESGAWYVWTANFDANNSMQLAYGARGVNPYIRAKVAGTWGTWEKLGQEAAQSEFGEATVTSSIALFPSVGCCGDSFTAGYLYNKTDSTWYDPDYVPNGEYPAIGYPAVMGRLYGIDVTAFAKGGLTSTAYRTDAKGLPAVLADTPKYLYIIALGLNDKTQNVSLGVEADIDTEPSTPTYLGNMGAIIRSIKAHAPYARIVLCKSLWMASDYYAYISSGIELLSSHLGIPYIETKGDPFFESDYYKNGLKGLHPTAPLYAGIGKRMGELVGKCVIENPDYFYNFYVPNE